MEKGIGGNAAGAGVAGAGAAGMSAVAPPDTGERSIADETGTERGARKRGAGGAPSGSIIHPATEKFTQQTLSKDADGTWRLTDDTAGTSWRWDPNAEIWRGEEGAEDFGAGVPPEEAARLLSYKD